MRFRVSFLATIILLGWCGGSFAVTVRDGDIVFQTSRSSQSRAIQAATHSPYSHLGLVLMRDGRTFVLEAVGPVRFTPFAEWVRRGEGGRFVAKRLRDAALLREPAKLAALRKAALLNASIARSWSGRRTIAVSE